MTPNVTIKAGLVTNLAYHQQEKEIIIPPLDRFLTINVEKSKDVFEPNEEAEFKLKVTDYKGPDFFLDVIGKKKYKSFFLGSSNEILNVLKGKILKFDSQIEEMVFYSPPFLDVEKFNYI